MTPHKFITACLLAACIFFVGVGAAFAQDPAPDTPIAIEAAAPAAEEAPAPPSPEQFALNTFLLLISGALVFWMHAGFACVEAGLTRSKNTVNILSKNVIVVCLGGLTYFVIGFGLMYPGEAWKIGKFLGFAGFGFNSQTASASPNYTNATDFFFQAVFAATAATIISGAVAERIKFHSFIIAAVLFVTFIYPIAGSWKWGAGWLNDAGFYDFAGSTIVHSIGGWAALTGAIILGPRKGKYLKDGSIKPIMGHSMPLATIGVFILFLGWFGFNGGSVLAMDPALVSIVYVTTFLAGCAGGIGAMLTSWVVLKKPDITMILNGILAGLVGITAGADGIEPWWSIVVGLVAGVIVVFSVVFFDKIKIDDPVGAISVHLVCGIWGTLAVALFSDKAPLTAQLLGIFSIGVFVIVTSAIVWLAIKVTIGLRVPEEEEINGLDAAEHGLEAYPDFQSSSVLG